MPWRRLWTSESPDEMQKLFMFLKLLLCIMTQLLSHKKNTYACNDLPLYCLVLLVFHVYWINSTAYFKVRPNSHPSSNHSIHVYSKLISSIHKENSKTCLSRLWCRWAYKRLQFKILCCSPNICSARII